MAADEDLTEYSYSEWHEPMVNVGWLGRGMMFETGPVSREILDELVLTADKKSNVMRGLHDCKFCDTESPIVWPAPVERGSAYLGTGESHVRGRDGTLFSAPSLVIHYITEHSYTSLNTAISHPWSFWTPSGSPPLNGHPLRLALKSSASRG